MRCLLPPWRRRKIAAIEAAQELRAHERVGSVMFGESAVEDVIAWSEQLVPARLGTGGRFYCASAPACMRAAGRASVPCATDRGTSCAHCGREIAR